MLITGIQRAIKTIGCTNKTPPPQAEPTSIFSCATLSRGAHARVGVVTRDKNRARFRRQCCVFFLFFFVVAALQNGRAITYQVNPRISGAKFFAASMRGFEWSKFQPRTCSGYKVVNGLGEDSERGRTIASDLHQLVHQAILSKSCDRF